MTRESGSGQKPKEIGKEGEGTSPPRVPLHGETSSYVPLVPSADAFAGQESVSGASAEVTNPETAEVAAEAAEAARHVPTNEDVTGEYEQHRP